MKFAVIPTANRPEVLQQCLEALLPQVDVAYVIDNGLVRPVPTEGFGENGAYIARVEMASEEFNLSKLWNIGLDLCSAQVPDGEPYEVAIVNDDGIIPPGWFEAVSKAMRESGSAAACSDPDNRLRQPMLHREPGPVGLQTRMLGWAFMLAGEKGLRFDEDMKWYFGDDDMDWRSRQEGGMIMIPGYQVINLYPNAQMTPELHAQTGRDREAFEKKWGMAPW